MEKKNSSDASMKNLKTHDFELKKIIKVYL